MKRFLPILLLLVGLSSSVVFAEVLLRLAGFHSWRPVTPEGANNFIIRDDQLGWANNPGNYQVPKPIGDGSSYSKSYWENGARVSRSPEYHGGPKLTLLGCSITEGYGLNDNETLGWKLQELMPSVNVLNFGTTGYGTCQSFILMQRLLEKEKPAILLYDLISPHTQRNVAAPFWLKALSEGASSQNMKMPYCDLHADGKAVTHPPAGYLELPLRGYSAFVRLVEELWYQLQSQARVRNAREITEALLQRMAREAQDSGAFFAVVLLGNSFENDPELLRYRDYLKKHEIPTIDCVDPREGTADYVVPGDNHPNASMIDIWSNCISEQLRGHCQRERCGALLDLNPHP